MILLPLNYTETIKDGDREYLFDPSTFNQKCGLLEGLRDAYERLSSLLRVNGYAPSWAVEIMKEGSDGLRRKVEEDILKRVPENLPKAVSRFWQRLASDDIPAEVMTVCDALHNDAARLADGLPLQDSDIIIDAEEVKLDTGAVTERIRLGCSLEITKEMRDTAKTLVEVAKKVKEIELAGVNAREIVGNLVTAKDAPSETELLRQVATRTHRPGCLAVDYGLQNNIINNFNLK